MKKIISCFILIFAFNTIMVFASFTDLEGEIGDKARLLNSLGIMSGYIDGSFKPANAITRAEFVVSVIRMLGIDDPKGADKPYFSDVDNEHWAFSSIQLAAEMGIVSGVSGGIFEPEESVILSHAIKMIIYASGYNNVYPEESSHFQAAHQMGVLNKISLKSDEAISRENAAIMLYNALAAPAIELISIGEGNKYGVDRNYTQLNKNFDIYELKGIVEMVGGVSIYGRGSLNEGIAVINGQEVYTGGLDINKLVGYYVNAFVQKKETDELGVIKYIAENSRMNNTLIINWGELTNYSPENQTISYFSDEGLKNNTARLAENASMMYNGRFVPFDFKLMNSAMASLRLIDNNNDGLFEVVFVSDYQVLFVGSVSEKDRIVYDKYDETLKLTLDEGSKDLYSITKDGQAASFDDIEEHDILLVTISNDEGAKRNIGVKIFNKQVSGKISEISSDSLVIDNNRYMLTPYYKEKLDDNAIRKANVSDFVTAYLDDNNQLFTLVISEDGELKTGVLLQAAKSMGLEGVLTLKIMDASGGWNIFKCEKRLVSNFKQENIDLILTELNDIDDGKMTPRLVQYRLNEKGNVYELRIAEAVSDDAELITQDVFRKSSGIEKRLYKGSNFGFLHSNLSTSLIEFFIDNETTIFQFPSLDKAIYESDNEYYKNIYDQDNYSTADLKSFAGNTAYYVQPYNMSNERYTPLLIYFSEAPGSFDVDENQSYKIISSVVTMATDEGNVNGVYYYEGGVKVKTAKPFKEGLPLVDSENKPLEKGDIIQVHINLKGEIDGVKHIASLNSEHSLINMDATYAQHVIGRVKSKEGNYILVEYGTDNGADKLFACVASKPTTVYKYSKDNDTLIQYTTADLHAGMEVVIRLYNSVIYEIIIVEK
ncbi:MAG: S-layer homology domain-containing protein [Firmicutes bacterium]|nr:S-layer homology domain-containing protein [Bacillota bacterium]